MRFSINRFYYWLDRKFRFRVTGWLLSFATFAVLSFLLDEKRDVSVFVAFFIIAAVWIAVKFLRLPKELRIEDGKLYTVQYLKKNDLDYRNDKNTVSTRKTHVTVLSATRIEYTQSSHEISRDMGRVLIFGTFLTGDKYGNINDVYKPLYVELYGIKNFSRAAAELRVTFLDAEHVL